MQSCQNKVEQRREKNPVFSIPVPPGGKTGYERVFETEGYPFSFTLLTDGQPAASCSRPDFPFEFTLSESVTRLECRVTNSSETLLSAPGKVVLKPERRILKLGVSSRNGSSVNVTASCNADGPVRFSVLDGETELGAFEREFEDGVCRTRLGGLELSLWDLKNPKCYTLRAEFGHSVEERVFGARSATFTFNGFFLNGNYIHLVGANLQLDFPYTGRFVSRNILLEEVTLLKRSGINVVCCADRLPPPAFLEACDRTGVLVIGSLPAGKSDEAHLDMMMARDGSHPSLVLWGLDGDGDEKMLFQLNRLAHRTDMSRQTAGISTRIPSVLIPDVYALGDSEGEVAVPKVNAPFFVSSHSSIISSSRRGDREFFFHHVEVLERVFKSPRICAALASSFTDSRVRGRFADTGLFDVHRNPKFCAYAYVSQQEHEPVLVSLFDTPLFPVVATNAEEVVLYRDGERIGRFYPDRRSFPHLPHPPVIIDDLWGDSLDDRVKDIKRLKRILKKRGMGGKLSRGDRRFIEKHELSLESLFDTFSHSWKLEAVSHRKVVATETKDERSAYVVKLDGAEEPVRAGCGEVVRLKVVVRREGANFPALNLFEPFEAEVSGAASLVSSSPGALKAGCAALYLKGEKPGSVQVSLSILGQRVCAEVVYE